MPGVRGLQAYVTKNATARDRVELGEVAKEVDRGRTATRRKSKSHNPRILCDFSPVVEWLLSAYDALLVKAGQIPPYALLYGGDPNLYGERILAFVRALEHVGVSPVFFLEGPPGADDVNNFEVQLPWLRSQHDRMLERCQVVHQVCEGTADLLQVKWQLSRDACSQIASCLQSSGIRLVHGTRGTVAEMMEYQHNHSYVVGVLSTNTDFAVAAAATFFPLSLFDLEDSLGIHSATICPNPATIVCECVSSATLCRSLQLSNQSSLLDIAILCGNQFSGHLNESLEPCKKLGMPSSKFEFVAGWVRDLDSEQLPWVKEELKQLVDIEPLYGEAIAQSLNLYGHHDKVSDNNSPAAAMMQTCIERRDCVLLKVNVEVSDSSLVAIGNGVYWRWPVLEPVSLGQSCFSDLTLPLRRKAYSLLGQKKVNEYGRTTTRSYATVTVESGNGDRVSFTGWSVTQRLIALFQLMTEHSSQNGPRLSKTAAAEVESLLESELIPSLPSALLACASLCYLCHVGAQPGHQAAPLEQHELQALLMTCLFCSASIPPHCVPERPSSRALALAMQFSHILQQAQLLGSVLGVRDTLPSPGAVFYPMAYIPHHLAAMLTLHPLEQHHSSNLKEAYRNYDWVLRSSPMPRLVEEIGFNWRQPNLKFLLEHFAEAVKFVETHSSYLFMSSKLSSSPPPHLLLNFDRVCDDEEDGEGADTTSVYDAMSECDFETSETEVAEKKGELQLKLTSPKSDHDWNELSSSQDRLVLEECHYFSHSLEEAMEGAEVQDEGCEEVVEIESEGWEDAEIGGSAIDVSSGEGKFERESEYNFLKETDLESITDESLSFSSLQDKRDEFIIDSSEREEDVTLRPPSSTISSSTCSSPSPSPLPPPFSAHRRPPLFRKRFGPDLPIAEHQHKLLELIEENRVVCVEGETGCGKSTQVPQYVLDHALSLSPPRECRVLVTQPRRVAAMKLAERVAAERGERVGRTVGYCIGGEHSQSPGSAITYCTTGYLLQALVHNPDMVKKYTHLVLDEIHERSTDADFTLLVVRELLVSRGPDVKLVIMSATMQSSLVIHYLQEHFSGVAGPYSVGAKNYGVDTYFIDELREIPRIHCFWSECQLKAAMTLQQLADNRPAELLKSTLSAKPYVSTYAQEVCTEVVISQAQMGESVLIFLPGFNEIAQYFEYLGTELSGRGIDDRFRIFVLHSQVPFEDQKDAFVDPPTNLAHVILATNIAESSITLPKLRLVVNFGIYRQLQYDSRRHISCLIKRWCSRASCKQRAGRAGRVFVGTVVHLFTRQFHDVVLPAYDPPEILTAPIAKLVLQAKQVGKKIGRPRPSDFLGRAIEPPSLPQLEAALEDLAILGAIESEPGKDIDEEADVTFLGHFSLSLPVDLELSRVVFYGILFGCAPDAVVIAAAMSLSQDVLSLPSRVVIKDESIFQQCLARSYESRCKLDSGMYSDAIVVRNLFKEWLFFRSENSGKQQSKFTLVRKFSAMKACRWERLLQLESIVSEIAQRALQHVPTDTAVHRELQRLVLLHNIRSAHRLLKHTPDENQTDHAVSGNEAFMVQFCQDENILRATLAASYPHHLLFGVRHCDSLNEREKTWSKAALCMMTKEKLDVSRTLVMRHDSRPNRAALQRLTEIVLPERPCQVTTVGNTALVMLNHTFELNPLTCFLRNLNVVLPPTAPSAPQSVHSSLAAEAALVSSTVPPELVQFWQFGERRPNWKVKDISTPFPRPQHPLATSWFRLTHEKEKVQVLSWRNPTGLVCEVDPRRKPLPFLAIAAHLQGFSSHTHVSASNMTLLPSLHGGRNAFIMALTFQPLTARVKALVNHGEQRIVGLDINSFTLPPLPREHCLDPVDVENINKMRRVLSKVFSSRFTSIQFSADLLLEIPLLLSELLQHGKTPHQRKPARQSVREEKYVQWEELLTVEDVIICESDTSDDESVDLLDNPTDSSNVPVSTSYQYLPPFTCSILQHTLPEQPQSCSGALDVGQLVGPASFPMSEHDDVLMGRVDQIHSDTDDNSSAGDDDSDSKANFKLSPNAPEFVPTSLHEDEAPSTTLLHPDDHSSAGMSTDYQATEPEEEEYVVSAAQVAVTVPPHAPPSDTVPLSKVLTPHYLSLIADLPPDDQQQIASALTGVCRRLLPNELTQQSDEFDWYRVARQRILHDQSQQPVKQFSEPGSRDSHSEAQKQQWEEGVGKTKRCLVTGGHSEAQKQQWEEGVGKTMRCLVTGGPGGSTQATNQPLQQGTCVSASAHPALPKVVKGSVEYSNPIRPPRLPRPPILQRPPPPSPPPSALQSFTRLPQPLSSTALYTTSGTCVVSVPLDYTPPHSATPRSPPSPQFPHSYHTQLLQSRRAQLHSHSAYSTNSRHSATPATGAQFPAQLHAAGRDRRPPPGFGSRVKIRPSLLHTPAQEEYRTAAAFSRSVRRPLMNPFQSKLDLHSRAPGALLASKPLHSIPMSHYQARFSGETSILPPFPFKLPGVQESKGPYSTQFETPNLLHSRASFPPPGFPYPSKQPASGGKTRLSPATARYLSSSNAVIPPCMTTQSKPVQESAAGLLSSLPPLEWPDLVDFMELYLQKRGGWAELNVVFSMYLRRNRLPPHTPFPQLVLSTCEDRLTLSGVGDHCILELQKDASTRQTRAHSELERKRLEVSSGKQQRETEVSEVVNTNLGEEKRCEEASGKQQRETEVSEVVNTNLGEEKRCEEASGKQQRETEVSEVVNTNLGEEKRCEEASGKQQRETEVSEVVNTNLGEEKRCEEASGKQQRETEVSEVVNTNLGEEKRCEEVIEQEVGRTEGRKYDPPESEDEKAEAPSEVREEKSVLRVLECTETENEHDTESVEEELSTTTRVEDLQTASCIELAVVEESDSSKETPSADLEEQVSRELVEEGDISKLHNCYEEEVTECGMVEGGAAGSSEQLGTRIRENSAEKKEVVFAVEDGNKDPGEHEDTREEGATEENDESFPVGVAQEPYLHTGPVEQDSTSTMQPERDEELLTDVEGVKEPLHTGPVEQDSTKQPERDEELLTDVEGVKEPLLTGPVEQDSTKQPERGEELLTDVEGVTEPLHTGPVEQDSTKQPDRDEELLTDVEGVKEPLHTGPVEQDSTKQPERDEELLTDVEGVTEPLHTGPVEQDSTKQPERDEELLTDVEGVTEPLHTGPVEQDSTKQPERDEELLTDVEGVTEPLHTGPVEQDSTKQPERDEELLTDVEGVKEPLHTGPVEQDSTKQPERDEELLTDVEGVKEPLLTGPGTSDMLGSGSQAVSEAEEMTNMADQLVLSGTDGSGSSSGAGSPHKPAHSAVCEEEGEDASGGSSQESASAVSGNSPGQDTTPPSPVDPLSRSASTTQLYEFEDADWVEGTQALGTSPTETASCDSHMTSDSSHMTSEVTPKVGTHEHKVEFFRACLLLVGGHSHINKLSLLYRIACGLTIFIPLRFFKNLPDIFQVKVANISSRSCIRLTRNLRQVKPQPPSLPLSDAIKEKMKLCRDACTVSGKNIAGDLEWPRDVSIDDQHGSSVSQAKRERRHSSVSWGREKGGEKRRERERWRECRQSQRDTRTSSPCDMEEREREQSWTAHSRDSRGKSSRFDRRRRPPRFPKDVESPSQPGHISHVLQYYTDSFAAHTEPVFYGDLLAKYVEASGLPPDFYLPSDLLKNDFEVYREQSKRYIRPWGLAEVTETSAETTTPPTASEPTEELSTHPAVTAHVYSTDPNKALVSREEQQGQKEKVEGSKGQSSTGKQKRKPSGDSQASNLKSRSTHNSPGPGCYRRTFPQTPRCVRSPSEPGHAHHILKFYNELFASCKEPLALEGFSQRYIQAYQLPGRLHIPRNVWRSDYVIYRNASGVTCVCPRAWRWVWSTRGASHEAPVSVDVQPETEMVAALPTFETQSVCEAGREGDSAVLGGGRTEEVTRLGEEEGGEEKDGDVVIEEKREVEGEKGELNDEQKCDEEEAAVVEEEGEGKLEGERDGDGEGEVEVSEEKPVQQLRELEEGEEGGKGDKVAYEEEEAEGLMASGGVDNEVWKQKREDGEAADGEAHLSVKKPPQCQEEESVTIEGH